MGVACLDWDHARRAGLHCLHLFSRGALGSDHPLAIELCQDLLEALNAFIDGSEPSMELKRYMARDLFQCINEGPTEGLHAIIKRGLTLVHHYGPNHVALLQHYAPIKDLCWSGAEAMQKNSELSDRVRTAQMCLESLGIMDHPVIQAMLDSGLSASDLSRSPYRKKGRASGLSL